ncbi:MULTISPECIES: hypothetical protein [Planktothrix]|uniref:hypothetical protein n=1 Tax=Planktothrix TaxID=54304 RepID=UPI0003FE2509|nr:MULTISPECIES: hypothetical protein [Planktothrix]
MRSYILFKTVLGIAPARAKNKLILKSLSFETLTIIIPRVTIVSVKIVKPAMNPISISTPNNKGIVNSLIFSEGGETATAKTRKLKIARVKEARLFLNSIYIQSPKNIRGINKVTIPTASLLPGKNNSSPIAKLDQPISTPDTVRKTRQANIIPYLIHKLTPFIV